MLPPLQTQSFEFGGDYKREKRLVCCERGKSIASLLALINNQLGVEAEAEAEAEAGAADGDVQSKRLEWVAAGEFERQSKERVVSLCFHHSGRVLACHTADRMVEFFRVNDAKEARKRQKKRLRRAQKSAEENGTTEGEAKDKDAAIASDQFSSIGLLRESHKIKAMAFSVEDWQVLLALSNNTIVSYVVDKTLLKASNASLFKKAVTIALPGHRSDVRALALSSDDSLLASGSSGMCIFTIQ